MAVQFLTGRWNRLTPRLREYLVAVALSSTGTSQEIAHIVGRPASTLWRQRDALLARGEIYESGANSVALTMPAMGPYALTEYPATRSNSEIELAAPSDMVAARQEWLAQRETSANDQFPTALINEIRGAGYADEALGGVVERSDGRGLPPGSSPR